MGTMYLIVPKVQNGGYIRFFVTERKRCEAALIQVVQEAYVQGVSTRKMEKLGRVWVSKAYAVGNLTALPFSAKRSF